MAGSWEAAPLEVLELQLLLSKGAGEILSGVWRQLAGALESSAELKNLPGSGGD